MNDFKSPFGMPSKPSMTGTLDWSSKKPMLSQTPQQFREIPKVAPKTTILQLTRTAVNYQEVEKDARREKLFDEYEELIRFQSQLDKQINFVKALSKPTDLHSNILNPLRQQY